MIHQLTAIVPTALWSACKKRGATKRHVMDAPKERKPSWMKKNNLIILIEGLKPGALCCLFK